MYVSIIFCKESMYGEVIFMFMTIFFVFEWQKFEISLNFVLAYDFADFWKWQWHLQLVYTLNKHNFKLFKFKYQKKGYKEYYFTIYIRLFVFKIYFGTYHIKGNQSGRWPKYIDYVCMCIEFSESNVKQLQ